jgi:prefoldin subunit 5
MGTMASNELAERDAMRQNEAFEVRAKEAKLAARNKQLEEAGAALQSFRDNIEHAKSRSEELGAELQSVRGMIEHAKCAALRLDSEASDENFAKAEGVRQEREEMLELLSFRAEELDAMLKKGTAHLAQRQEEAACVASTLAKLRQDA